MSQENIWKAIDHPENSLTSRKFSRPQFLSLQPPLPPAEAEAVEEGEVDHRQECQQEHPKFQVQFRGGLLESRMLSWNYARLNLQALR